MNGRALRWALAVARPRGPVHRDQGCVVTIVRHHRVYADAEAPLYRLGVRASLLARQLGELARLGRVVTLDEAARRLAERASGRWIAITFDDGYADNVALALPLLRAAGVRATFFLTAGLIERRGTFWWDEAAHALGRTRRRELEWRGARLPCATPAEKRRALERLLPDFRLPAAERDALLAELRRRLGTEGDRPACALMDWAGAGALHAAGMELGAHTLEHPHLTTLDAAAQAREVAGSRRLVEERVGVRPASFAYPGGEHDDTTVRCVREAGFACAVTTGSGDNRPGADPFRLWRRALPEGTCLSPSGRFSSALLGAELAGAFDGWRGRARRSA